MGRLVVSAVILTVLAASYLWTTKAENRSTQSLQNEITQDMPNLNFMDQIFIKPQASQYVSTLERYAQLKRKLVRSPLENSEIYNLIADETIIRGAINSLKVLNLQERKVALDFLANAMSSPTNPKREFAVQEVEKFIVQPSVDEKADSDKVELFGKLILLDVKRARLLLSQSRDKKSRKAMNYAFIFQTRRQVR